MALDYKRSGIAGGVALAEWLPPVRFISAKGNPADDASYPRRTGAIRS